MRPFAALLAAALALALAGCGGDDEATPPEDAAPTEEPVGEEDPRASRQVTLTSFAIEPGEIAFDEPGTYALTVVNDGDHPHALAIAGPGLDEQQTATLSAGETDELVVSLEAGEYELWCPVANHRGQGMEGTVTVGGDGNGLGY